MSIKLKKSRQIKDYEPIFGDLVPDFGYVYYHAILMWCGILKDDGSASYWKVWLIKDGKETVGICGMYSQYEGRSDELWLGWFGIMQKYRNKGIGSIALGLMEEQAKKDGCKRLMSYIDKDKKPLKFYKRHGFKLLGTVKSYLKKHKELEPDVFEDLEDYIISKDL